MYNQISEMSAVEIEAVSGGSWQSEAAKALGGGLLYDGVKAAAYAAHEAVITALQPHVNALALNVKTAAINEHFKKH